MVCCKTALKSARNTTNLTSMRRIYLLSLIAMLSLCPAMTAVAQLPAGSVVDVWFSNPEQVRLVREQLDVWGLDRGKGSFVVYLPDGDTRLLEVAGLRWEVNPQRTRQILLNSQSTRGDSGIPGFACYRTVEETFADLSQLAADNPDLAEWIDIGDSWQLINNGAGFDVNVIVISNRNSAFPKSRLMIMAAMHAREYTTAELVTRFAEMLINQYGLDADITWLLDHNEIHIVPQVNPDGRDIAEQPPTRFKRKNDNELFCPQGGLEARGVDLNRNNVVLFGGSGSSGSSCNDTFRGPSGASEPETLNIQNYLDSIFPDARPGMSDDLTTPAPSDTPGMFISVHSFSELILFPWEGVSNNSGNHAGLRGLARKLAFFNGYTACQDCLGTAAGTTPDYAYGELGLAALTYELGTDFDQDCATFENQILPDNLQSLLFAAKSTRRPYQTPNGPEVTDISGVTMPINTGSPFTITAQASDLRRQINQPGDGEPAEAVHNVTAALYSIDLPPFAGGTTFAMMAADGSFDSMTEMLTAQVDTVGLNEGLHTLFITATDSSGQTGVPSAVFFTLINAEEFFIDGFEAQ